MTGHSTHAVRTPSRRVVPALTLPLALPLAVLAVMGAALAQEPPSSRVAKSPDQILLKD